MTCSECIDLLQLRLDGRLRTSSEPTVATHLETCVECRGRYAAARSLEAMFEQSPMILPSPSFAKRMTSRLLTERRRQQRNRWLTYAGSAVAAGLLLALGIRFSIVNPATPDNPSSLAVANTEDPIRLQDSVAEARSAMANMTSRAADETVGPTRQLLATITKPEWRELPPMDQPARSLQDVGQGVSSGFEPVATSAHRALDMLIHNLTPNDYEEKGVAR